MRRSCGLLVSALMLGCTPGLDAPHATFRDAPTDAAPERDGSATECGASLPRVTPLEARPPVPDRWLGHSGALHRGALVVAAPNMSEDLDGAAIYGALLQPGGTPALTRLSGVGAAAGEAELRGEHMPYFGPTVTRLSGISLAVGDDVLAVGVAGGDTAGGEENAGRVEIYRNGDDGWQHAQTLTAPALQPCALFGYRVAISGDVLTVGAPGEALDLASTCGSAIEVRAGGVHVFRDVGGRYAFQESLRPETSLGAGFGASLAFDAERLAVGAPFETVGDTARRSGAAYVLRDRGSAFEREARITEITARAGALFGASVALDGEVLVVGAPLDDACRGFRPFGNGGRVYTYLRAGDGYEARQCLHRDSVAELDLFGWSVAVDDAALVVGAPFVSGGDGAAYRFARDAARFGCAEGLRPPGAGPGDPPVFDDAAFGTWVAAEGPLSVVGAPWTRVVESPNAGTVYVFDAQ